MNNNKVEKAVISYYYINNNFFKAQSINSGFNQLIITILLS